MKTPICTFDAKTGTLCSQCESRLRSGALTSSDIEASIKLTKLGDRNQDMNKFTLIRAAKIDNDYILTFKGSDITFLRANPSIAKKIEDEFKAKVWFIEADATDRKFIENLFFPVKISGVNLFWLPDGNKLTRVILSGTEEPDPTINIQNIKKIAKEAKGIDLLVEFEHAKKK